ncbi:hypothetical protein CHS0354_009741, partial [Potamilus streckersoni]
MFENLIQTCTSSRKPVNHLPFKTVGFISSSSHWKGLVIVGAFSNVDHGPSSTTATGYLHGSGIG